MQRVLYVHWNEQEAEERAARVRELGYSVEYDPVNVPGFRTAFRSNPTDAVIIDLSRLPSHGKEVAVWLTDTRATCHIPIVFLEGLPEKVTTVRERLPHATFANWKNLEARLKKALRQKPAAPPPGHKFGTEPMSGYSGTPLARKLGIREGTRVVVVTGPSNLAETLTPLPESVQLLKSVAAKCDLMLWFPRDLADFIERLPRIRERVPSGGIWIAWKKKSSGESNDLTQNQIRDRSLETGLVDYKVCSIDQTWSGLKFAERKAE